MCCRIALLEDDVDLAYLVKVLLDHEKMKLIHHWTNAHDSMADDIEWEDVDVAIIDINIPGDDSGLHVVEWLKNNPMTSHVPVIVYTSTPDLRDPRIEYADRIHPKGGMNSGQNRLVQQIKELSQRDHSNE